MNDTEPRTRGLNAVQDARKRRSRPEAIPTRFWPWLLGVLAVWGVIYWYVTDTRLDRWRSALLARQRELAAQTAPRYNAMRDRIEAWTLEASGPWPGDRVTEDARTSRFRERDGVYLRLHLDDARDVSRIRTSAADSLRDGFTSCFSRSTNPDPFQGPACTANRECPNGQHCNQERHCSAPAQPFNLRVAYRGARVLTEDWAHEVAIAGDDMRLRLLEREFQDVVQEDMPLAMGLVDRAEYFVLVLDEPATLAVEEQPGKTRSEGLQTVAHPTRVLVYDLRTNAQLLRVREQVTANVGVSTSHPEIAAAVRRQANNCALALAVSEKLGDVVAASER